LSKSQMVRGRLSVVGLKAVDCSQVVLNE
jgi:hypothetical protein